MLISYFGKLEKVSKNLENRKQLLFSRLKPNEVSSCSDSFFQKLLAEYFNSKLTDDVINFQGSNALTHSLFFYFFFKQ